MAKTVNVRIAVAVDPDGQWSAVGWGKHSNLGDTDKMMQDSAADTLGEGEAHYWVEAELPIPETEAKTVQGEGRLAD